MKFGEFVRELRTRKRLKLREFCLNYGHDPSNWSKMERGDLPPSEYRATLEKWAEQLDIKKGSDDWYKFFDLAFQERGKIPDDLLTDEELVESLPLFFRTFRGKKPSEQELDKMIELLRKR
ncbi:MAG: helix-turn-helix transcriptional regulator [Ignavibacteriaceae bacterium]